MMTEFQEDKELDLEESIEESNEDVKEKESITINLDDLEGLAVEEDYIDVGRLLESEMVTSRTLYLSEEITLETINHIIMLIHKFNRDDYGIPVKDREPIKLYLDSVGGELYRSLSVCSAIESSATPVIGIGQGMIASGALLIYLSTHYRYLSRFATVMYHELRAESGTETLREMQNKIQHYADIQNKMDKYIVEKTKVPLKKLKKQRKRNLDWFISEKDLAKYKFYDEIID